MVDEISDAGVARQKLGYWRQEIEALYDGNPAHPVTRALALGVKTYGLDKHDLLTVIDGMQMDLERTRYATWDELSQYCHRVAGVVGWMSAQIFGYTDPRTREYAHTLGMAFQLTNIIRDVGEDGQRGRIYLPLSDLVPFGVQQSDLLLGTPSRGFVDLMRLQTARAQALYADAFAALPRADRQAQKPGLMMAAIYQEVLHRIETQNFPVLKKRVSLSPIKKLMIALTVWLKP